jgi:hypothetical protein
MAAISAADQKRMEQDLISAVRQTAALGDPALAALERLLKLRLKQLDYKLRRCLPAEVGVDQGRALVYEKLLDELFR